MLIAAVSAQAQDMGFALWFLPQAVKDAGYSVQLTPANCETSIGCAVLLPPKNPSPDADPIDGNLMKTFGAAVWRGTKIRLTVWLRIENGRTGDQAGLWIRVDRRDRPMRPLDTVSNQPVRGLGWMESQMVYQIPNDAEFINFGVITAGTSSVWIRDVTFECVGQETSSTLAPFAPENLDFAEGEIGKSPPGWFLIADSDQMPPRQR